MSVPELKSFDRVAQVYDETRAAPPHVAAAVTDAILAELRTLGEQPGLLEVGIGTGRIAVPLAAAGVRVTGIDISPAMVAVLRSKTHAIDVVFAEAAYPPFRDHAFDAALFVHILHLVPDPDATMSAVIPLVRPGGALIHLNDNHDEGGYHLESGRIMWDVIEEMTDATRPPAMDLNRLAAFNRAAQERGLLIEDSIIMRYDAPYNARRAMEHMRRRDFSSHWAVPEDRFDEVAVAVERRYEELWGDLDIEHPAQKTVGMTVARLP